jgi:2-octaprenyl-6-methoxyphenol hydroxylase
MREVDIVIAGGGMVGLSLALALERALGESRRVLLVEGFPLPAKDSGFVDHYSPSFDARSTALSYSSRRIYDDLGIWGELEQRSCAIETIHVSDRGRFGSTVLRAGDYGWPALGHVVENAWLGTVLAQCFHERPALQSLSPERVADVEITGRGARLTLAGGDEIEAGLLVVADGADSGLRERLGVAANSRPYGQQALVANIGHAAPHSGRAFERFTDQGPLAVLPLLPGGDGGPRSALVWTLAAEHAETLSQCDEDEFLGALQERFGYRLGRLTRVGERSSYPLALVQSREQVRSHVVIMGNAAHSLHPVAGQGFNLALRDVEALVDTLARSRPADSPGSLSLLQQYRDRQSLDQRRTTAFSDRLPGLFMQRDPLVALVRDLGLLALDNFRNSTGRGERPWTGLTTTS